MNAELSNSEICRCIAEHVGPEFERDYGWQKFSVLLNHGPKDVSRFVRNLALEILTKPFASDRLTMLRNVFNDGELNAARPAEDIKAKIRRNCVNIGLIEE